MIEFIFLVIDTDNTELLKKCGTVLPDKVISNGNKLTVKFKTDYSVGAKVDMQKVFLTSFCIPLLRDSEHLGKK